VLDPETGLRFSSRNLVACLREGAARMGVSMALYEHSGLDARRGAYVDHDLAGYQMATNADVAYLEAVMVDEEDAEVNPVGVKGLGEVGIVGTAAAIGNAVHHATGVRAIGADPPGRFPPQPGVSWGAAGRGLLGSG
jgi:CO/xanthine dehydrogenase Mo-binding subunit